MLFVTSRVRANPGTDATINRLSSKKRTKPNNPNGDTVVFFVLSKREKRERERVKK